MSKSGIQYNNERNKRGLIEIYATRTVYYNYLVPEQTRTTHHGGSLQSLACVDTRVQQACYDGKGIACDTPSRAI